MSDPTLTRGADASYRKALLDRLGEADPIHELSALFERLPEALVGLGEEELRKPEGPGKWSVLQVVQHLADAELVQAMRIRRILVEDHPALVAMDQDAWASRLWSAEADLEEALDTLRALRLANLRLVSHLPDEARARDALHPERGVETLDTLLRLLAAHDLVHLEQIARIRAAIGASPEDGDGSEERSGSEDGSGSEGGSGPAEGSGPRGE